MKNISIRDFSLFFALILIWIFFAMQNGQFLSPRNISMLGIELAMTTRQETIPPIFASRPAIARQTIFSV